MSGQQRVLLAGGQLYRRVMRAAMSLFGAASLPIEEVSGGTGIQRSRLGPFLSETPPQFVGQIGSHPDGVPVFRRYGAFEVGTETNLQYRATPGQPSTRARILGLFQGPMGATAEVNIDSEANGREKQYALGRRKGHGAPGMTVEQENQRVLNGEARRLAEHLDGTAEALLALTCAATAIGRRTVVSFSRGSRHALLLEILRYCAEAHLLEFLPFDLSRVEEIEQAMDDFIPVTPDFGEPHFQADLPSTCEQNASRSDDRLRGWATFGI